MSSSNDRQRCMPNHSTFNYISDQQHSHARNLTDKLSQRFRFCLAWPQLHEPHEQRSPWGCDRIVENQMWTSLSASEEHIHQGTRGHQSASHDFLVNCILNSHLGYHFNRQCKRRPKVLKGAPIFDGRKDDKKNKRNSIPQRGHKRGR